MLVLGDAFSRGERTVEIWQTHFTFSGLSASPPVPPPAIHITNKPTGREGLDLGLTSLPEDTSSICIEEKIMPYKHPSCSRVHSPGSLVEESSD